ncbi:imidazole glycerol phosphate synthase subunit HisH [Lysinibacillus piscis]|uniref:Imidazole glycerol phosphate synthase subunit HisH n=1 Tax=Lysinibacillus piscis TaxID=2518931 RepID=A0ABQ5NPB7_9BACI|nr:imidazole glycerol phosphate synthase subunit HisH [Lysinibacillus sp. KH24]GLC89839.1 imidazole glycerol phosphate synthase subunit HisH [Lysinibacillus sp. KH24]
MKIGVIDYGMGNLFSVEQALKRLDCEVFVTAEPQVLDTMDALLLPGVGAFPDAMKCLQESQLDSYLQKVQVGQRPLLGICLGMQLLFEQSEEVTPTKGLGFFKGQIQRFSGNEKGQIYRVPHMGWNELVFANRPTWLTEEALAKHVYFVHSFYAANVEEEQLVAYADYHGIQVPGIVANGSVTGMQFHPEKSGDLGMSLLAQWLKGVATC